MLQFDKWRPTLLTAHRTSQHHIYVVRFISSLGTGDTCFSFVYLRAEYFGQELFSWFAYSLIFNCRTASALQLAISTILQWRNWEKAATNSNWNKLKIISIKTHTFCHWMANVLIKSTICHQHLCQSHFSPGQSFFCCLLLFMVEAISNGHDELWNDGKTRSTTTFAS